MTNAEVARRGASSPNWGGKNTDHTLLSISEKGLPTQKSGDVLKQISKESISRLIRGCGSQAVVWRMFEARWSHGWKIWLFIQITRIIIHYRYLGKRRTSEEWRYYNHQVFMSDLPDPGSPRSGSES